VSVNGDLAPKVHLVDRQESRLLLLSEQGWNCLIFDHRPRTQVRDEAYRAAISVPHGGLQIAAQ
jgi:hypothetical protein